MGLRVASRVRGLSDEAFREAFGTEDQCRSALVRLRWPNGFMCRSCGHRGHCILVLRRGIYQCNRCKTQVSVTAGTIFHATKLPLVTWFAAIHLIMTTKNGISSVELGRRLGVKQPTAWTTKQKIMAVMAKREADTPLEGRVEMDDAWLGGARSGGKRGRGAPGKTPFVAAVSTSPEGRPRKVKLTPLDFIARLAALVPRPRLNLTRFHGVFVPNCKHRESVAPKRKPAREQPDKPLAPMTWMRRLKRVFAIDIKTCPKCGGTLRVIACIENPDVIAAILEHVGAREAAATANPRAPPIDTEIPAARYQARLLWKTAAWRYVAAAT